MEVIFEPGYPGHYQLMTVGWHGQHRIHGCVLHVDIKDGKIWIQHDGTEEGIANRLVAAGVPRGRYRPGVSFAVHAPEFTDFAVNRPRMPEDVSIIASSRSLALATTLHTSPYPRSEGQPWPDDPKPSPSPDWLDDLPVSERRLDNGLRALVLPAAGAPIVVCDLYYPVGSFDEPPGQLGPGAFCRAHALEGDRAVSQGSDRPAGAARGAANPTPRPPRTAPTTGLPSRKSGGSSHWRSRPTGCATARFDPREVEVERRVIVEERARELNSPQGRLDQTHLALTYLRHPYRNPILGWPEDTARIGVDDLTRFYRHITGPTGQSSSSSAIFDRRSRLDRIAAIFADVPQGAVPRTPPTVVEPGSPAVGISRCSRPMEWRRRPPGLAHCAARPSRRAALDVLADLLSCGRRSRLWQSLVEDRPWPPGSKPPTPRPSGRGNF